MKSIDKISMMDAFYATPVPAFRLATETNGLDAVMIFSTTCQNDTGLILVMDEMDEEY